MDACNEASNADLIDHKKVDLTTNGTRNSTLQNCTTSQLHMTQHRGLVIPMKIILKGGIPIANAMISFWLRTYKETKQIKL